MVSLGFGFLKSLKNGDQKTNTVDPVFGAEKKRF
jgi:hypothetical protein